MIHTSLDADGRREALSIGAEPLTVLDVDRSVSILQTAEGDLVDAVGEFLTAVFRFEPVESAELFGVESEDRINITENRFVAHLNGELESLR